MKKVNNLDLKNDVELNCDFFSLIIQVNVHLSKLLVNVVFFFVTLRCQVVNYHHHEISQNIKVSFQSLLLIDDLSFKSIKKTQDPNKSIRKYQSEKKKMTKKRLIDIKINNEKNLHFPLVTLKKIT